MAKKKFLVQDYFRYKRLKKRWRKPKGSQSKMRKKKSGSPPLPNIGYGSLSKMKGRIYGLVPLLVKNASDLEKATKDNIIILSSTLGLKKAYELGEKAKKLGLTLLSTKKIKKGKSRKFNLEKKTKGKKTKKQEKEKKETPAKEEPKEEETKPGEKPKEEDKAKEVKKKGEVEKKEEKPEEKSQDKEKESSKGK
jgi:large subunit ribosomal protein L32e